MTESIRTTFCYLFHRKLWVFKRVGNPAGLTYTKCNKCGYEFEF